MIDDFFSSEEEYGETEENELISRYENMVKYHHAIYLSSDDYVNLFIHYTQFYKEPFSLSDVDKKMTETVIHAGISQYPQACLLKMFYVFYRYLTGELSADRTVKQLKNISIPDYERMEQGCFLIQIYRKLNALSEAGSLCSNLLQIAQTDDEKISIYWELIFLFAKKEDIPNLIYYCEKLLTLDPQQESWLLQDLYFHLLFKPEAALLFFESYAKIFPFSHRGWMHLGNVYILLSIYAKAATALENAVAIHTSSNLLLSLGNVYFLWEKWDKSLECFHEAMTLSPERTDFYDDIADVYCAMGEFEMAVYYYGLSLDAVPDNVEVLTAMAVTLAADNKYEEAIDYLTRALKTNAPTIEVLLLMADYLIELDRDEEAISFYEQAIEKFPSLPDGWLSYSMYYADAEDYTKARLILGKALEKPIHPFNKISLIYRMANYCFLSGDYINGNMYLRIAYQTDPGNLDLFLNYDEQTTQLPEVIDIIRELTHKY
ncbi:MAG: tetratricopeptide repeat protein [Bacteroidales bacterium]|jgi:tetratricopeptide (TPR) repeat protein|nr:tetratricopeptide repeat protein [Bacteroidales bacterium]